MSNIQITNPWVLDITPKFQNMLDKFNGDVEKLKEFHKTFGYDSIPYDGIKRWGLDSSTESSDIKIDDLEEGMELWWRRYTRNSFRWTLIRVTHIYGGIMFFETIGLKKNIKSYVDTGANDLEWKTAAARYSLPKHTFYPVEVIKPSWVDIEFWNAPKQIIITNK